MYGAAIGTAVASDGDTQFIGSMAVTKCADQRATHECLDADIRHKKQVDLEWIPSHRKESEACDGQERE